MITRSFLGALLALAAYAEDTGDRLDAAAKSVIGRERVVGASVLVAM